MFFLLFVGGCAKKAPPLSTEDNPQHHYLRGMVLLEKGDTDEAARRFGRALELEPDYPPALAGSGIVHAVLAAATEDAKEKNKLAEASDGLYKRSLRKADNESQEFIAYVAKIRSRTVIGASGFVDRAEDAYEDAMDLEEVRSEDLPYYGGKESAGYFMGQSYLAAYEFRKAEDVLSEVLSVRTGQWHAKTDKLYKKVQKILRASANHTLTGVAREIAIKDSVVRVDVVALLVDELPLDTLFSGYIQSPSKKSQVTLPSDVVDSIFRDEIGTVVGYGIRGLEPVYDTSSGAYLFKPFDPISRQELAFILEDIVIKVTGDDDLATKYFGQGSSPYPDVSSSSASFNAVMNAVSRGLMETDLSGAFRPGDPVDGADLLLAVFQLKNVMKR